MLRANRLNPSNSRRFVSFNMMSEADSSIGHDRYNAVPVFHQTICNVFGETCINNLARGAGM